MAVCVEQYARSPQVFVGENIINRTMVAPKERQPLYVYYPFEKDQLYTIQIWQRCYKTQKERDLFIIYFAVNVDYSDDNKTLRLVDDAHVDPKNITLKEEYTVAVYRQSQQIAITAEMYDKEPTLDEIEKNGMKILGCDMQQCHAERFCFYMDYKPSSLYFELLQEGPMELLWKLIQDYNINMQDTPLSMYMIANTIVKWRDLYLADRKL